MYSLFQEMGNSSSLKMRGKSAVRMMPEERVRVHVCLSSLVPSLRFLLHVNETGSGDWEQGYAYRLYIQ